MSVTTAGYSEKPLGQKLGIKAGAVVEVIDPPLHYRKLLEPLPYNVYFYTGIEKADSPDIIHLFCTKRAALETFFEDIVKRDLPKTSVWISWPKKSAKIPGELDENIIREVGLSHHWVDVKVCAIDAVWSRLKFVQRKLKVS